jgi:5'-nucleotidase
LNPKNTKVLITNDDGFSAHGIDILYEISCLLFKDVWLIAPATEQSGKGHSLTLRNSLQIIQKSEKKFSIDGTPTDCVILGLNHLMKNDPPDLILSGINKGTNLGEDITYSGTIGAAIEATISGVPAIALSQEYNNDLKTNWSTSKNCALELIKKLLTFKLPKSTLLNVNFPIEFNGESMIEITRQGSDKVGDNIIIETHNKRKTVCRIGAMKKLQQLEDGTDIGAIKSGNISVTPISIDFTNHSLLKDLKALLNP